MTGAAILGREDGASTKGHLVQGVWPGWGGSDDSKPVGVAIALYEGGSNAQKAGRIWSFYSVLRRHMPLLTLKRSP